MIRFPALLGLPVILIVSACAQAGQPADPGTAADPRRDAFEQRANAIAQAWQAAPQRQAWRTGYVPLQDPTVLAGDPKFSDETKLAFLSGWYRARLTLPATKPADGNV